MITIETQVELKPYNSFSLNAIAHQLVRIKQRKDIEQLTQYLRQQPQDCFVLGAGTNLVLSQDIKSLIIKMQTLGKKLVQELADAWIIEAQAGENWHDLVQWTLQQGWGGLENLALIPSSVGAAPVQNIGAYGVEIKDVLDSVEVLDLTTGEQKRFSVDECQFAYRDSIFKSNVVKVADGQIAVRYLILSLRLRLAKNWQAKLSYSDLTNKLKQHGINQPSAQDVFKLICQIRQAKLPDHHKIGNAGSFFKNPLITTTQLAKIQTEYPSIVFHSATNNQVKLAAGWLIDCCGLKGKQIGGAAVYHHQALVLYNANNATGDDVVKLATYIQQIVFERFGVGMEIEPLII